MSTNTNTNDEGNVDVASLLASMSDEERRAILATFAPSSSRLAPPSRGVASTLVLARELSEEVARDEDEARPLVDLANLASEHVLRVEILTNEEGTTRMRMRCSCSRSSYLALASDASTPPSSLVVALRRHVRRVRGRALRIARNDASVSARLALLLASEGGEVASPLATSESVVATLDEGGEEFARVSARGGRGATTHLTREGDVTLCERDASSMSEDVREDVRMCRDCEAHASA